MGLLPGAGRFPTYELLAGLLGTKDKAYIREQKEKNCTAGDNP